MFTVLRITPYVVKDTASTIATTMINGRRFQNGRSPLSNRTPAMTAKIFTPGKNWLELKPTMRFGTRLRFRYSDKGNFITMYA